MTNAHPFGRIESSSLGFYISGGKHFLEDTMAFDFYEWTGGASEEEVAALTAQTKKRYYMWLLISLIPLIGQFTIGLAIFCYNNYAILKSRGRNDGNGLWRLLMMLWGLIIIPIIEVQACARIEALGNKVLGW